MAINHVYDIFNKRFASGKIKMPQIINGIANYDQDEFYVALITKDYEFNEEDDFFDVEVQPNEIMGRDTGLNQAYTDYSSGGKRVYFHPMKSSSDVSYFFAISSSVGKIAPVVWKKLKGEVKYFVIYAKKSDGSRPLVACYELDTPRVFNGEAFNLSWGNGASFTVSKHYYDKSDTEVRISNIRVQSEAVNGDENNITLTMYIDYVNTDVEDAVFPLFTISNSLINALFIPAEDGVKYYMKNSDGSYSTLDGIKAGDNVYGCFIYNESLQEYVQVDHDNPVILSSSAISDLSKGLSAQIINSNFKLQMSMTDSGSGTLHLEVRNITGTTDVGNMYVALKHLPAKPVRMFNQNTGNFYYQESDIWVNDNDITDIVENPFKIDIPYVNAKSFDATLYSEDGTLLAHEFVSFGVESQSYEVVIESDEGNVFRLSDYEDDDIMLTLTATVFKNGEDITDELMKIYAVPEAKYVYSINSNVSYPDVSNTVPIFTTEGQDLTTYVKQGLWIQSYSTASGTKYTKLDPKNYFTWSRVSSDKGSDSQWNEDSSKNRRGPVLEVRKKDCIKRTSFYCTVEII